MKQMIASWSMVMVHGLMFAGPGLVPRLIEIVGPEGDDSEDRDARPHFGLSSRGPTLR